MIDDLTMLANLPVLDAEVAAKVKSEVAKAAASTTMPPTKPKKKKRANCRPPAHA